jgi:cytochrome P450
MEFRRPTTVSVPTFSAGPLRLLRGLRRDPLRVFTAAAKQHGTLVRLRVPGLPLYLISDPDAIHDVLTYTHRGYLKGLPRRGDPTGPGRIPLQRVTGQGLLTTSAEHHRRQRRLLQPLFHRARIAAYADTFVALAAAAAARWHDGETIDVHRDMTELTLAIVARTVFDVDLDSQIVTSIRQAIAANEPMLRRSALPGGQLLERLPLPSNRRWNADLRQFDAMIYGLIAERRAGTTRRDDLLSLLLSAVDAETGEPLPDRQIRDEAVTLLLAGHETTANALAWTLYLLGTGRHATGDPRERLHAELDQALGDRLPTMDDLQRLPYTTAVVHEAMRLYPPAWLIIRRLAEDRDVCGYRLVAGSVLVLTPWVVHRDPRWWPAAESFQPERWLPEIPEPRPRAAYFPFGGGPRQCIGNTFAETEAVLVLATLCRQWTFSRSASAPPVVPEALVTLRPRDGITMKLRRR